MSIKTARTLLAAAGALAAACKGKAAGPQGPPPMPVKLQVAEARPVDEVSEYVATLKSRASSAIMPQVEGHVTKIFVRPGQRVAAGAPLMEIDPAKQQATVRSQEDTRAARQAALEYARQQHRRVEGLHAAGISSQADLDQAKAALDSAAADLRAVEAQVREQQVELQYHRVSAPAAGVVGDIPVRVGDRVTNSTQLTTVDSPQGLEAYISVPVERAPDLKVGMPVRLVDSTGAAIAQSVVSFVSPEVDDKTQTVLAKARVQGAGLRPAQFIRARVVWGSRQTTTVPVLAVSRISGQHFAYVAEPDGAGLVARQRQLRLGEIVGNEYVVLDGIKPGDKVVVSGAHLLRDGAPVAPQS